MAPYCAIPRDYFSDTPLLRAMGFLVSQHGQLGAIPHPLFLSVSPLESIREVEVRTPPPPQKGYLSDTCAIPYENKANGCDTPLCDTISKGYCAIWGGISRWAAKVGKPITRHAVVNMPILNRFCTPFLLSTLVVRPHKTLRESETIIRLHSLAPKSAHHPHKGAPALCRRVRDKGPSC